jgi:hypothetical protein
MRKKVIHSYHLALRALLLLKEEKTLLTSNYVTSPPLLIEEGLGVVTN